MSCSQTSSGGHAHDLDGFTFPERRDDLRSQALRLERETDLAFQIVIPAHCLLIRTGIDDSLVVNAVLPHRVSLGSFHDFAPRIRRTEVRPIWTRRAISDLLTPARCSFRISAACTAAVAGRPSRFPFSRAWAKPARVRSRRISRSNSAKMASRPAIARPAGVVRSSASVSDTKPTPRCSSSWSVASRSVTDRPQRSSRHTSTTSISRRRAASSSFSRASRLRRTGAHLADLQGDRPAAPGGILPHGAALHRKCLLIVRGNAGVQAGAEHFRRSSVPGQKRYRILPLERPVWRAFRSVTQPWPQSILFGQAGFIILRAAGVQPCQRLAVVPRHPLRGIRRQFPACRCNSVR